jgi:methylated-DNA-[protein]-cysteine S-methyltransferase
MAKGEKLSWCIVEGGGIWVGAISRGRMLKKVVLGRTSKEVLLKMEVEDEAELPTPLLREVKEALTCYLCGDKVNFSPYPLQLDLPPAAKRVLLQVKKIPYAEVRTYKWVARKIGTRGYRAVGRILSLNPFPIIIPCHRVVRTDGGLGGFSAGIELKKRLLEIEGVSLVT